jgi:hypothetical protein
MCLMNNIFSKYLDKFLLVFFDDILIYSESEEENEENLRLVLQVLGEHQLYAKLRKCDFYQSKVRYLGHVISKEGIVINPKKIATIMEWPTLKHGIYVISVTVIARYYRRFIKGFSRGFIPSLLYKGRT